MPNPSVIVNARRAFFEYGGQPTIVPRNVITDGYADVGRPLTTTEVAYSGKHNGLALYFARMVKPIWKERIVIRM